MRKALNLGIGAGAVAAAVTMVAGVASATSGAPHQATSPAATAVSVNKLITKAQAVRIAEATVPHSRAIEVQSDDLHDRAVWKVTLATPQGRVVVDVDKRTGKATIVRGSGGGHDAAMAATGLSTGGGSGASRTAAWGDRDARDDDGDLGDRDHDARHDGEHRDGHDDNDHGDNDLGESGR